jgi:hypothetical protein
MNPTLAFLAGFLSASAVSAFYIYQMAKRHLTDLEKVKEAGRKRGYAEGYQRKALSAFAPTN